MKTFTQGHFQPLIVRLQQFFINFPEITFPFVPSHCVKDSREIVSTAENDLILLTESIYIAVRHSAELSEKFRV